MVIFTEKHSLAIRLWHWVTVVTMAASLILVLLASTMFGTRDNMGMVQEQLERKGAIVTPDQARAVAHEYSDKLWMAHKWVGYGLCFLLLARVVIEVFVSRDEKLWGRIKRVMGIKPSNGYVKSDQRHYLFIKEGYLVFYVLFLIMALTGLGLAYEEVPLFDTYHRPIKKVHEFVQYLVYAYLVVHLIGVIRADVGKYPGIISGMINGKNKGSN